MIRGWLRVCLAGCVLASLGACTERIYVPVIEEDDDDDELLDDELPEQELQTLPDLPLADEDGTTDGHRTRARRALAGQD